LRVHFINLDRSKDRLAEFRQVNGHMTDAVRFPAVDGQSLDIQSLAANGLVTANILDAYVVGAVGCAMSHLSLWNAAIETGQPVTVCEDDAIFNHGFESYASRVLRSLPPDWDFIQWGWNVEAFFI
jgi:glycosyl transferase family 25